MTGRVANAAAARVAEPHDTVDVYELLQQEAEIPADWLSSEAKTQESRDACPLCHAPNRVARSAAPGRTAVLNAGPPRRTRTRVCLECEHLLFADLSCLAQDSRAAGHRSPGARPR